MRHSMIAVLGVAGALVIAGCGGSGNSSGGGNSGNGNGNAKSTNGGGYGAYSGGGSNTSTGGSTAAGGKAEVKLASSDVGRILTDASGRTLYLFERDKGAASTCYGACAAGWPPLTTKGQPSAAGGLTAAKLGTIARRGGGRQVTYAGHPLYYFAGDAGPGQMKGEGIDAFGAEWYVLGPSGGKVEKSGS